MKIGLVFKRIALFAVVPIAFGAACAGAPAPQVRGLGSFGRLVWSDEFDGPAVDQAKWYVKARAEGNWPDMPWRRNYKSANAYVENGALVLRTVREGTEASPSFSTGAVETFDYGKRALFEQTFGRFEARVKFPTQAGHWCAFWMMPPNVSRVDDSGRDGTEIDIMEKAWTGDRIQHALHWDGYGPAHKSESHKVEGMNMNDGGWHVFRLDWYPDLYVFFVDGVETWRTWAGGVSQVPAHILLTEEIGNSGTGPDAWGQGPIQGAALPDYFLVDYVRVWEYLPPRN
jgi:beta-glucanase (GH16 family)